MHKLAHKHPEQNESASRNPNVYIPTLYFAEGLPYTIVIMMSGVLFKNLGASNEFIGLTSFLYIPWTIKLFWAPLVDLYSTKRTWIIVSQLVLSALIVLMALGMLSSQATVIALCVLALIAFASATQDIAIDGYYLDVLKKSDQAFYVGIRNAAYKVAWLLGSGGLVYLAGKISEHSSVNFGWFVAFGICALVFALLFIFHSFYLPNPKFGSVQNRPKALKENRQFFLDAFATYFTQPKILAIVTYILIFRLGDALMLKMAQPFLLDEWKNGGLGISTADVGLIYGTVGTIFLLAGGIFGGLLIAKDGLRKWLLPTAIIQNSAIILYFFLAYMKPQVAWVYAVNSLEQFSYGLGVAAYTVFLLSTVKTEFKAAHYAIATAMMALGIMLPGAISGYLVTWLGYTNFFLLAFLASIPGIITIYFLPLEKAN
jgi:PAT family beta-lactamase induction signal transducer AmpG